MRSRRIKSFHKLFARLPLQVQQDAIAAYKLFHDDPYHPSLHFKQIDPQDPIMIVDFFVHTELTLQHCIRPNVHR